MPLAATREERHVGADERGSWSQSFCPFEGDISRKCNDLPRVRGTDSKLRSIELTGEPRRSASTFVGGPKTCRCNSR